MGEDPSLQTDQAERENDAKEWREGLGAIEDTLPQTRSRSETRLDDSPSDRSMARESDQGKNSDGEDKIQRWMGRRFSKEDPFDPIEPFGDHWQSLQADLVGIFQFCRVSRCPWEDMSDAQRDWFTSWMPENQVRLDMSKGDALIWVDATLRFLWEQLLSPDRPDDLWRGPHWAAFGKVETEMKGKSITIAYVTCRGGANIWMHHSL
jgi:hypothetical protein